MAQLVFIIFSNQSVQSLPDALAIDSQRMVIINPVLILRPKQIPTQFSFAVTIGLRGIDVFQSLPSQLQWRLIAPNNNEIFQTPLIPLKSPNPIPENVVPLSTEDANIILGLNLQNVNLPTEGRYRLIVNVDNQEIGDQSIPVLAQPKNSQGVR